MVKGLEAQCMGLAKLNVLAIIPVESHTGSLDQNHELRWQLKQKCELALANSRPRKGLCVGIYLRGSE